MVILRICIKYGKIYIYQFVLGGRAMNKLFLIDGAAGTGKSDLVNFVKTYLNNYDINIVSKHTTREPRIKEEAKETDLSFVSQQQFKEWKSELGEQCYTYPYGGSQYGFSKSVLIDSVTKHEFTFVIVRNKALIDRIQEELKEMAYVLHIFIYTDEGLAAKRLKKEGFDNQAISFRLKRNEMVWMDYVNTSDDNIITIINNSNKEDFHKKILHLIKKYSQKNESTDILYISPTIKCELIVPLIGYKEKLQRQLKRYPYEKNVFLMMKFRDNNIEFYRFIKRELGRRGLNCVRADEAEWNLTNDVYNPLAVLCCCKYGIALFDEPEKGAQYNPNVAYELGMMHYQRKDCLILRHSSLSEVPFDLIKNLYVTYSEKYEFESIMDRWLTSLEL